IEGALAGDRGTARPMDDHRFIWYLADQFEACGGKASAYANVHADEGYAKTPFRSFVHHFYSLIKLELASRRTRAGLDETICAALVERRRRKKGESAR